MASGARSHPPSSAREHGSPRSAGTNKPWASCARRSRRTVPTRWARTSPTPAGSRPRCAAPHVLGGLDIVVNAAAVDCEWKPVGELGVESWNRTIAINLSGTFYVCRASLPLLVAGGGGVIVNVTSVAGMRVWPLDSAYNVSKAGVEMLTRRSRSSTRRRGSARTASPRCDRRRYDGRRHQPGRAGRARAHAPARQDGQRRGGCRGCGLAVLRARRSRLVGRSPSTAASSRRG